MSKAPAPKWVSCLAACLFGTLVGLTAQAAGQKSAADLPDSTLKGVYNADQARNGQTMYATICMGCHNLGSQTGMPFALRWRGHPLSELYQTVKERMPPHEPGSLTATQTAQVIAYLLKMNGMPPGPRELPTEVDALEGIQIEIPSKK